MDLIADTTFHQVAQLAYEQFGLHITQQKRELVTARLSKLIRTTPFDTTEDYLAHLMGKPTKDELLEFFDVLSTNVTSFFRESAHFDYLEREFYTPLARGTMTTPGKKIRMWSAACSTGQEPYTMAMHAMEHLPDLASWDFKILATDLSTTAVEAAKQGVYEQRAVSAMPQDLVERYFDRGTGASAGKVRAKQVLRDLVTVGRLNLNDSWPFAGPFDVIFCRNVMIYFDQQTRQNLVMRLHGMLRPGGILAVGSAESLSSLDTPFESVQPAVYRK